MAATSLALAASGTAIADNLIADGDGLTAVANAPLAMGEVCATNGTDGYNGGNDRSVALYLERTGGSNASNLDKVWPNSTAVGLTQAESHAAIGVTMPTPASITTDLDWVASGTLAGPANAVVRVQSLVTGSLSGTGPQRKITFSAAATAADSTTWLSKEKDVEVTATIVDASTATSRDCVLPSAVIATPAAAVAPATVTEITQNAEVASSFSCADETTTAALNTGINLCKGTVLPPGVGAVATPAANSGFILPTSVLGVHRLTVTATDNAGNVKSESRDYEVVAPTAVPVATFLQPVDGNAINLAKAGRVIPVKVSISVNGTAVDPSSSVTLTMSNGTCATNSPTDAVEDYSAGSSNTGAAMRHDSGKWIYNLATGKAGTCQTGTVKVGTATAGTFNISYTK